MKPAWVPGLAALMVWTSSEAAETARSFVVNALQADNTQVKFGLLAEARGSTQAVRQLGRTLKLDHFDSRRQAIRAAHRLHIRLPVGADRQERAEYGRLVNLRGRAFDREYIAYVTHAQERQLELAKGMKDGSGPALQLARADRPRLQSDLTRAKALGRNLGSDS